MERIQVEKEKLLVHTKNKKDPSTESTLSLSLRICYTYGRRLSLSLQVPMHPLR